MYILPITWNNPTSFNHIFLCLIYFNISHFVILKEFFLFLWMTFFNFQVSRVNFLLIETTNILLPSQVTSTIPLFTTKDFCLSPMLPSAIQPTMGRGFTILTNASESLYGEVYSWITSFKESKNVPNWMRSSFVLVAIMCMLHVSLEFVLYALVVYTNLVA